MLTGNFAKFLGRYPLPTGSAGTPWAVLREVPGYTEIAGSAAGLPLCDGLLRVVDQDLGSAAAEFVQEGFPEFSARALPFAVDWIGRVYAVDRARERAGLLLEPGSAEAFELDGDLFDFFNTFVVDEADLFLATDLLQLWVAGGGSVPGDSDCVGFKVPLFLGGDGTAENLEIVDRDVYWSVSAQLRRRTRGLPPGARIDGIEGQRD